MVELDPAVVERIDDLCYRIASEDGIPGLSVAVTDDAETLYAAGYGSRALADNDPATPETVYGVASVTKSFVALSVLTLVEDGALDVSDPLVEHVDVDVPASVTLHDLLTHSSGYPSLGASEALLARVTGGAERGVPLGDRDDFEHYLAGAREQRIGDPGERFAYCNSGYVLLGDVVEAVDGRSFADYATDEILDPLGMERSTFDAAAFEALDDRMTPYRLDDDGPEETPFPARSLSHAPGGLTAPVTDLARYLRLQLNGGERDGERIVGAETLAEAHAGHVETPDGPYGYGWRRRETCGRDFVGHSGSLGVSSAYVGFSPTDDLGVAIGANTAPHYPMAVLGQGILACLLGGDPETAVPFFERRERFERLTGSYESYGGVREATVERDGQTLRLTFEDEFGGSATLVPADGTGTDDRFWALTAAGNRQPAEFLTHDDGVALLYERWRLEQT